MSLPLSPLTNDEIKALTPLEIAKAVVVYLSMADTSNEYCPWRGRNFDDLWENGRGDEIALEFAKMISQSQNVAALALSYGGQVWVDHFLTMLLEEKIQ